MSAASSATAALPTLESSGYPLAYRSRLPKVDSNAATTDGASRQFSVTVEAATLDGMQKEGFVTAGRNSSGWRLPTDESTQLRGRDAAPQPLALHNAAVQACVLAQLKSLVTAQKLDVVPTVGFDSHFNLRGSFFRGDVKSTVRGLIVRIKLDGALSNARAIALARQALRASPSIATLTTPLVNTFSIRLNSDKVALPPGLQSAQGLVSDPSGRLKQARETGPVGALTAPVLEKLQNATVQPPKAGEIPVGLLPDIDRSIHIRGEGSVDGAAIAVRTSFFHPLGSVFAYRAGLPDDDVAGSRAPSPLAYLAGSVAFCFMTQFHRYAEVHKLPIEGLRVVQIAPFAQSGSAADGTLAAECGPIDTHIFVDAAFDAARCEDMLRMAHRTCFLHAALSDAQPVMLAVELNGEEIAAPAEFASSSH